MARGDVRPLITKPARRARNTWANLHNVTVPLKALPFGSMIQEYRIKGVLGAGGFGIVYVAENTYLPEIVAMTSRST